jgi:formylglycine-generating enzyme required for sulfatase activity
LKNPGELLQIKNLQIRAGIATYDRWLDFSYPAIAQLPPPVCEWFNVPGIGKVKGYCIEIGMKKFKSNLPNHHQPYFKFKFSDGTPSSILDSGDQKEKNRVYIPKDRPITTTDITRQPFEPEMVLIPSGKVTVACHKGECSGPHSSDYEVLVQAFEMGKYEVTFDEWDSCVNDGGCKHRPDDNNWGRGNRPVINVNWEDVQQYIKWLSLKTGKQYRLPKEYEWAYVAKAGETWDSILEDKIRPNTANLNFGSKSKSMKTLPVGSFPANRWGLHDLFGNANEWMAPYEGSPVEFDEGPNAVRLVRGGGYNNDLDFHRLVPFRYYVTPQIIDNRFFYVKDPYIGFRVARTLTPTAPLSTAPIDLPAYENPMKGIMVVGTWGRAGGGDVNVPGGVESIIKKLKKKLLPLGVPEKNIYAQAWNSLNDDLAGPAPITKFHFGHIKSILKNHNLKFPSYLVLFGHSFGGWETARLSREMDKYGYTPDVVFLFDPVIGPAHYTVNRERQVKAQYGVSFYQTNSILEINPCINLLPPNACLFSGNVSCGFIFQGLKGGGNKLSTYRRNLKGEILKKQCSAVPGISLKIERKQAHVTIDDDEYLQKLLIDRIVSDVNDINKRQSELRY